MEAGPGMVEVLVVASPRGWCAGVERAVEMVEQELAVGPVHLRHAIVHNDSVIADLGSRGARVVEDMADVPTGATVVVSAHGAPPWVRSDADRLGLRLVDATCPLVSKVHAEVRRFAAAGYTILVVGHAGHVEVIGTMGEAPTSTILVSDAETVATVEVPDPHRVAWVCQTTLSVPEAATVAEAIRNRFPDVAEPHTDDICYATTNRQEAVVALARRSDLVLVVGSATSSNSWRMVERARATGCRAELVDDLAAVQAVDLAGAQIVGLSSGASAPEHLVTEIVNWFVEAGARREDLVLTREEVSFSVPPPVRASGH